jgi:hypothetical protein
MERFKNNCRNQSFGGMPYASEKEGCEEEASEKEGRLWLLLLQVIFSFSFS